jgi:two-component system nitrogen regulation sensor histidine kinase NtrY
MRPSNQTRNIGLVFAGIAVAALLGAVFTFGSLNLPIEPHEAADAVNLWALSTFIVIALLVFGLILARSLLRLWTDRHAGQPGARFKTKMVLGAMSISLLPVVFLFFVSYALLNRTLGKWFPRPLEIATSESRSLLIEFGQTQHDRLSALARTAADSLGGAPPSPFSLAGAFHRVEAGADAIWTVDSTGKLTGSAYPTPPGASSDTAEPRLVRMLPSGSEIWDRGGALFIAGRAPWAGGSLVVARHIPDNFLRRYTEIEKQTRTYAEQGQLLRSLKTQMLLTLLLFTLLLVFSVTWVALYLSKQVTVPIMALAEATREISRGNLDYRVEVQAQDELGALVRSFNSMTAQLGESRAQVQEFNRNLQKAVTEIEHRRRLMETILENIPTGVLSLEADGMVSRINPAVIRMFGEPAREARTLEALLGPEAARGVDGLMRRSLRMGAASKELEVTLPGRVLRAAVTVSSLGPRRANPGYVVVIDDLSELLHAQKSAAWQEVAQRIAHEIKNPLTPIQLSAQRLSRAIERREEAAARGAAPPQIEPLVAECAGLIEREVAALEALVDEFSQFARFPEAKPVALDLNAVLTSALEVFSGRLDGVSVRVELASDLPPIKADPELLRRVLVNLIDNAAESMEASSRKELTLETRLGQNGEVIEIAISDTGHGIAAADKDRLFLPHFSTRERGTGLGLAIADRIIAEHHGTIRVEDNPPQGSRFVIRLPLAEVPAGTAQAGAQG